MKRNIYLSVALLLTAGVGITYFGNNSESYTPRTEAERSNNVYLSPKERSIKGAIEYYHALKRDVETNKIPGDALRKGLAQADAMSGNRMKQTLPLEWAERGPDNVGGRTRAILVDNRNNNIMYCGGVSGGLFKSTNRGQSWSPIDDLSGPKIIVSITQTPDGDIYVGTGEENFLLFFGNLDGSKNSGFVGTGVYRSTDGENFEFLPSTSSQLTWRNTNTLACEHSGDRIYAGNDQGLYWSEDDGANWTKIEPNISAGARGCREVVVTPEGTVYAHIGNKLYRSYNGKTNFEDITPAGAAIGRLGLDYSRQDYNYVYFLASKGNGSMEGVYRSKDKGDSWEKIIAEGTVTFDPLSQFGTTDGQGLYDLAFAVDPRDKNRIYMGGVQLAMWKEGEGESLIATTFGQDPRNSIHVHADKHVFVWDETVDPPVMWIGSDGGVDVTDFSISSTTGRPSYARKSIGLNIYQSFGLAANEQRHIVSGSQDNSNQIMNFGGNTPLSGVEVWSGDGFQNDYSRLYPGVLFVESQFGNIGRSQNSGESFSQVQDDRIAASGGSFPFNTMFRLWENLDGTDSSSLFAVGKTSSVFISPNILDFSVNPIFFKVAEFGSSQVSELTFTEDADKLYVGTLGGQLYRLSNVRNATYDSSVVGGNDVVPDIVTENISTGSGLPSGRTLTGIAVDNNDSNFMVVVYGNYNSINHVYVTTDLSNPAPTFVNKQGTLPDVPFYDVEIAYTGEANSKRVIIVGTEIGIFASDDDGATWTEQNTGMARVPVFVLRSYQFKPWEGYRVYAGTHGRGTFECLSLMTGVEKKQDVVSQKLTVYPNPASNYAKVDFELNNREDVVVSIIDIKGQVVVSNTHVNQTAGKHTYTLNTTNLQAGTYFVRVETKSQKGYSKLIVVK